MAKSVKKGVSGAGKLVGIGGSAKDAWKNTWNDPVGKTVLMGAAGAATGGLAFGAYGAAGGLGAAAQIGGTYGLMAGAGSAGVKAAGKGITKLFAPPSMGGGDEDAGAAIRAEWEAEQARRRQRRAGRAMLRTASPEVGLGGV